MDIHKVIGKIPFKPKKGYVLPRHHFSGPYNPLHLQLDSKDNPLPGNEPYNAVNATSTLHDICYRNNHIGKSECDRKMLEELNGLVPKGRREAVDRGVVRSIIGLKHKIGMVSLQTSCTSPCEDGLRKDKCPLNRLTKFGLQI